ncbi:MAG: hypothetical protein R3315_07540 [Woeseiaceae bacterium]|nr:hypothetical protein [Woeseiaceae bacterium]
MTRPAGNRQQATDFRRLALAVFAVFCAQLALAGHQFQHDEAGAADICGLCVQVSEFDAPPVALTLDADSTLKTGPIRGTRSIGVFSRCPAAFEPRAPPAR